MLPLQLAVLLISLPLASSQSGANEAVRAIPQWGVGLIAVTVFLFLVLILYVANIAWEKRSKSNLESISMGRFDNGVIPNGSTGRYIAKSSDHERVENAYDNPIQINDNEYSHPL